MPVPSLCLVSLLFLCFLVSFFSVRLHLLLPHPCFLLCLHTSLSVFLQDSEKKGFMNKLYAIQDVCISVQNALDEVASYGERIKKWVVSPLLGTQPASLCFASHIPVFFFSVLPSWFCIPSASLTECNSMLLSGNPASVLTNPETQTQRLSVLMLIRSHSALHDLYINPICLLPHINTTTNWFEHCALLYPWEALFKYGFQKKWAYFILQHFSSLIKYRINWVLIYFQQKIS